MSIRIDQWLWAARLYKTRSLANQACRGGKVQIAGGAVKPARPLRESEIVEIKQPPIVRQYLVKGLAAKRVSAALARELVEEITPAADLEILALSRRDPLGLIFACQGQGQRPADQKGAPRAGKTSGEQARSLKRRPDPPGADLSPVNLQSAPASPRRRRPGRTARAALRPRGH